MDKEDDIAIDLSKLSFWKKKKKQEKAPEDIPPKDEEETIDLKSIGKSLYKYRNLIIILAMIVLMIHFRMYPANIPAADQWARDAVIGNVQNQIAAQIQQQYPHLPDENKRTIAEEQFQEYYAQNEAEIERNIATTAENYRNRLRDENGYTYLADIDSYVWLRYAENIIENGHVGDKLVNDAPFDSLIRAPLGGNVAANLYPYVEAYLWYFLKIFNPNITIMRTAFYTPFFFSILAIIAAFYLTRRIAGTTAGFFASVMVAIHPFFLQRTFGSDTDSMIVTFPLLILWMFIEAIQAKDLKKGITFAAIAGLLEGIYAFGWVFWYVFDFILAGVIIYLLFRYIRVKKYKHQVHANVKPLLITVAVFIISTGIFVSLFTTPATFFKGPIEPLNFLQLKVSTTPSLWPNVYTTVAELNSASISDSISSLGGKLLFVISLLGTVVVMFKRETGKTELFITGGSFLWFLMLTSNSAFALNPKLYLVLLMLPVVVSIYLLMKKNRITESGAKLGIILAIWYAATIFASLSGVRFILLLVPIFSVAFGVAIGQLHKQFSKLLKKTLNMPKETGKIIMFLAFGSLLIAPITTADAVSRNELPIMNDGWWNALSKIRAEASPDAIINSWWDFGHHFKYVTRRAVTFDGASQNTPMAHWIGRALLTNNEKEAVAILRMLDCGSNTAFDEVNEKMKNTRSSIELLKKIILLERTEAKLQLIQTGFSQEKADNILELTHCSPPENYFITSEDMVRKAGVWAHFGSWDFDRAEVWLKVKNMPEHEAVDYLLEQGRYNTPEKARTIYREAKSLASEEAANAWIAPWPTYGGSTNCALREKEGLYGCSNGVMINATTFEAFVKSEEDTYHHPNTVTRIENGRIVEKEYTKNTLGFAMTLLPENQESFQALLSSEELGGSLFNKLFFLDGIGLKHFEKFTEERTISGQRIIVWKVKWE